MILEKLKKIIFFQVPEGFKIVNVFDLFFKAHKLFNIQVHPNLSQMILFVEFYIFKMNINQSQLTTKVHDLALRFESVIEHSDENGNQLNTVEQYSEDN